MALVLVLYPSALKNITLINPHGQSFMSTFALVKHADVSNFCLVDIESDKVIFHGHVVFF